MTTINTQLPYAYAHMVSLIVNIYLVVLATWLGFFFSAGFPTTGYHITNSPDAPGSSILRTVPSVVGTPLGSSSRWLSVNHLSVQHPHRTQSIISIAYAADARR